MAPPITIAVATDDKISTITAALESAKACSWCDELLVFDSGSTDGTADVAKELADRVEFHQWTTYADSKRRMCDAAHNDWIFILDADEQITPELAAEIAALPDDAFANHPVMTMPRKNFLLGRHVKAWDPDRQNRLFDRNRVAWPDRSIHDERKPTEGSERKLSKAILHNPTVDDWTDYFDGPRYADRIDKMAREMYAAGRRVGFVGLWLRPPLAWFKYFILKGGFTQGTFGLVIAQKAAGFTQLKYARLWHLQQTKGRGLSVARLPFNPDELPDRDVGKPARRERQRIGADPAESALTVTQLTLLIKDTLADHTPRPVCVVGEISNFSERGHWYLSLKDEENVLNAVMWKSAARKIRFDPQRGTKVVATGRLDYYGPQARLQMYVDKLEPVGQGELELRFRQLCDELRELGYFVDERKRPMPSFPQHIAVITSEKGAAVQDVIRTARQRWAGIRISVMDVPVQGGGAAPKIARAVRLMDRQHEQLGIDAVVLTRGGGSLEDLWAFNEREVADAVFEATVPIAAAIGHEVDTTIAELVSDLRCSTPTQAAERLIPDARAELQRVDQFAQRLRTTTRQRLETRRTRVEAAGRHELFRRPSALIQSSAEQAVRLGNQLASGLRSRVQREFHELAELSRQVEGVSPLSRMALARQQTDGLARRLRSASDQSQSTANAAVKALSRQLEAIGPKSVLTRGFSYTTDDQGRLIRRKGQVSPGKRIVTHVLDGQFESQVLPGEGNRAAQKAKRRKNSEADGQDSLFG